MASKASRAIHLVCSATVALAVLLLLGVGYGPVPALGQAPVPGGGVWDSAAAETAVSTETLTIPGLDEPVKVSFTAAGYASIQARPTTTSSSPRGTSPPACAPPSSTSSAGWARAGCRNWSGRPG